MHLGFPKSPHCVLQNSRKGEDGEEKFKLSQNQSLVEHNPLTDLKSKQGREGERAGAFFFCSCVFTVRMRMRNQGKEQARKGTLLYQRPRAPTASPATASLLQRAENTGRLPWCPERRRPGATGASERASLDRDA
jgi:hypothetical protein